MANQLRRRTRTNGEKSDREPKSHMLWSAQVAEKTPARSGRQQRGVAGWAATSESCSMTTGPSREKLPPRAETPIPRESCPDRKEMCPGISPVHMMHTDVVQHRDTERIGPCHGWLVV